MHSTSTLNSGAGESHSSTTSTITSKSKAYGSNLRHHKQKENFLSRLAMPFLKVARPHKEIEWKIKRSKLSKIIYEQTGKFLTCPYKLELDGGFGAASNPRLTLYIHPYGREDDTNINVTLEVGIEISTRPKAQRLDSRAEVEVNVRAEDREKMVVFGQRVVQESVRLNYFYIKGFFRHQDLKKSHSEHILVIFSANLISVV